MAYQPGLDQLLVLKNEILEHSLLGCNLMNRREVNLSKLFDVDWPAILFKSVSLLLDSELVRYFVRLVVVLRIVLEDLLLFNVMESLHNLFNSKFLAPDLAIDKPVELSLFG